MAQRDELKKQRQAEEDKKKTDADAIQNYDQQIKEMELYGGYFMWRGMKMSGDGRIMEGVKALLPLHLHCIGEAEEI